MNSWVLDASALMALLYGEPGFGRVGAALVTGAAISTVNLSEVIAKLVDRGVPERGIRDNLDQLDVGIVEFNANDALAAGLLRSSTRSAGLSFGDRACLALASRVGAAVLTADRAWAELDLDGIEVELVR